MERVQVAKKNKVKLFLDSGAYGAWSRGKEIKIKDYIGYCKDNAELIHQLVNLDVIPGKFGRRDNTQREVEVSAQASYKNQQILKDAGLKPIPVFHAGERLYWLEKMIEEGETYIGLSPAKFVRVEDQIKWLGMCFNMLCDSKGKPYVKTHGFAATSYRVMVSFPWRSVDSTTWSLTPGYGQIIVPTWLNGEYNYNHGIHKPTRVILSGVAQKSKTAQEKQFEAFAVLNKPTSTAIEKYITEVVGSTMTQQRYSSIARCKAMLTYYVELAKHISDVRHVPTARIYGPDHLDTTKMVANFRPWNMILYFATEALHREWASVMNSVNANDRLLSYWYLKDRPDSILDQFVQDGHCGEYEQSPVKPDWGNESYRNRRKLALFLRIKEGAGREAD